MREDPEWDFVDWTASWVSHPDIDRDSLGEPIEDLVFRKAWIDNIHDVHSSDFVLLYSGKENALRGALIETGAAIGIGCPVIAVGLTPDHSWAFHPLVTRCDSLREARLHLFKFTVMIPRKRRDANE